MTDAPLIMWFRRDLRLHDHPMLSAAVSSGRPLIPLFILDPETEATGTAAKWRWGLSIAAFAEQLAGLGSRLVLRRGPALTVLQGLVAETGATAVAWSRLYDPACIARDTAVKAGLKAQGVEATSHDGHLLHEPHTVLTGTGGFYRVYTPYWRAVKDRPVSAAQPAPTSMRAPDQWSAGDDLQDWQLAAGMHRGAAVVRPFQRVGEAAALARMDAFLNGPLEDYADARNICAAEGTSGLSQNLTFGEIGIRTVWHAATRALHEGRKGAETFLKELVWREFSYHLIFHTPHITTANWKPAFDDFPWRGDNPDAEAWKRGMTGEPLVDAAMREMFVTGIMHNRGRMIVASYLTKHLMTHWRVGLDWFADCLTDWDPASNAMGWQWAAGSGPDASPYFRIFNPATQAEKFDADAAYRKRFIAELSHAPGPDALAYFDAVPRSWDMDATRPYPLPLVDLGEGRTRALNAYGSRNSDATSSYSKH
jgi:deoxyribodipyrimidine photo-lyase